MRRFILPLVIAALVVAAGIVMFVGNDGQKTLTAYFPRTVSLYEGSDVRVLGVPIGTVSEIDPEPNRVKVVMHYDKEVEVPAEAKAAIISPSVVGDRYVQLTPAYTSGKVLADDAVIDMSGTAVPLELDQIYASLNRLNLALGPDGANENGALSDLLEVTAENFGGQGARFNQTIEDFSELSRTLDDNKEELFASTEELGQFIETLAENDDTVRDFNQSLSQVSDLLAGEREELAASLATLGVALEQVGSFVEENRGALGENITGLNRVAKVLVKRRDNLDQILRIAPVALNNLALTYNPDSGTLDTNANIGNIEHELQSTPGLYLCSLLSGVDQQDALCDILKTIKPPSRAAPFGEGEGESAYSTRFDPTLGGLVSR